MSSEDFMFGNTYVTIKWVILLFFSAMGFIPYCHIRDNTLRTIRTDEIYIAELNYEMLTHEKEPPFPFMPAKKVRCGHISRAYAKVSSMREAEDWLLNRGYKVATVSHNYAVGHENAMKPFPFKGDSLICLIVDYGDGNPYLLPFNYPIDEIPFNYDRFQKSNKILNARNFGYDDWELRYDSTDGCLGWFDRITRGNHVH